MKIKNLSINIFSFVVLFFLLAMTSACRNNLDSLELKLKPKQIILVGNGLRLGIAINPKSFSNSKSRTILPETWTEIEKSQLSFRLNINGMGKNYNIDYTWDQLKTGYSSVILGEGSYTFTMTANMPIKIGGTVSNAKVLKAVTTKNIGVDSNIKFLLESITDYTSLFADRASGGYNIKLIYRNPNGNDASKEWIKDVKLSLSPVTGKFDPGDPNAVDIALSRLSSAEYASSASPSDYMEITEFSNLADPTNPQPADYSSKIPYGEYTLNMEFIPRDSTLESIKMNEYIVIDPGKTASKTIYCPINFEVDHNRIANFRIEYQRPGDMATKYKLKFTWDDLYEDELGFKIEILDSSGNPSSIGPYYPSADSQEYTTGTDFTLGSKYKARISVKKKGGSYTDPIDYKDPKNGNIIHLNRLIYRGNSFDRFVEDPQNPLSGRFDTIPGSTHDVYAYYTCRNAGFEYNLPGPIGLPAVHSMGINVYGPKRLDGWDNEATPSKEKWMSIPTGATGSYTLKAKWSNFKPISAPDLPEYPAIAYLADSSNYMYYIPNTDTATHSVAIKIATSQEIVKVDEIKWYFDGELVSVSSNSSSPLGYTVSTDKKTITFYFNRKKIKANAEDFDNKSIVQIFFEATVTEKYQRTDLDNDYTFDHKVSQQFYVRSY